MGLLHMADITPNLNEIVPLWSLNGNFEGLHMDSIAFGLHCRTNLWQAQNNLVATYER